MVYPEYYDWQDKLIEREKRKARREKRILESGLGSRRKSMEKYFFDRADVARCVSAQLKNLQRGSLLIISIERDVSGDYCVSTATGTPSEDTEKNTSPS